MMKGFGILNFKKIYLIFSILIVLVIVPVSSAEEFMKLEDIQPGMMGIAKTVFYGYKVEEFSVEIIDVVEDQGLNKNLILFKAAGDNLEGSGGIASGMSGSPVYIDGKLIGAIGYGWELTNHRFGMITPIEDMLKLLKENKLNNTYINKIIDKEESDKENLKTPLFISGLQGRAFNRMKNKFEDMGFEVLKGGSTGTEDSITAEPLMPGSAVAVQMVRGDINVGSIGTLTYKKDNKILALGHPFFNKGDVEYLLSRAYINGVIPSLQSPFKIGSPTDELIGTVDVDRSAGVAGQLNKYPKIVPLNIFVKDDEHSKSNNVNVQLVKDEDMLTSLITNVSLQTIDSTLDRIGKGTANVNFKITGKGLPELGIERDNVFYSRSDIAAVALYEVYNLTNLITRNPFREVNIIDIQIDVEIKNENKIALVQEAKVLNKEIKPGDTLDIEVTLHPYRSEPIIEKISFKIPEDISSGTATLVIDGGFTGESYQTIPQEDTNQTAENQVIIEGYKNLDTMLEDFLQVPKNNELIVQVFPGFSGRDMENEAYPTENPIQENNDDNKEELNEEQNPDSSEQNQDTESSDTPDSEKMTEKEAQEIKELFETEYVLEGSLSLDINIQGDKSK
ncbi:MAG: SpoIVB peptidase S55 domain-containing protein [Halanaerobiaceae bacterium]